jgi:hypothetical protein
VNVYVNGALLGCVRAWQAFCVKGLDAARGMLRIRLVLVNPAGMLSQALPCCSRLVRCVVVHPGEEVLFPHFNADEQEIILTA